MTAAGVVPLEGADEVALSLVALAVTVRTAQAVGCPHLASRAAVRVSEVAGRLVAVLGPARLAVSVEDEHQVLEGVADLGGLMRLGVSPLASDDVDRP